MKISPYFVFNGHAKEAILYYAEAFGVENYTIMTFGEAPQHPDFVLPEEAKDLVMHGMVELEGANLLFSDTFPSSEPVTVGNQITLAYMSDDEEMIHSVFNYLSQEGIVNMPLQATSWSKCYGQVRDKFGTEWQLNYEEE